jgi:hypothetical protein
MRGSRRSLLVAAGTAAAVLAAPAPAPAAVTTLFRSYSATLTAVQTHAWQLGRPSGCGPEGGGVEEITFTARPQRVLAQFRFGDRREVPSEGYMIAAPGERILRLAGQVRRTENLTFPAADRGDPTTACPSPPVHDCRTGSLGTRGDYVAKTEFRRTDLQLHAGGVRDPERLFASCYGPSGDLPTDWGELWPRVRAPRIPGSSFFTRRRAVVASRTFHPRLRDVPFDAGEITVTSTVRWELGLRAVGPRRRQCSSREFPPPCLR